jgi:hypothetical protein
MFPLFAQLPDQVEKVATDSGQKILVTVIVSAVTSLAAFLFGRYYGRYKARREWMSKEFFNRVIVSLNIFADGFLKIRTVMERSIEEVFLNPVAIEKVGQAAKQCSVDDPLLRIPKDDRWFVLNFVLNAVAEIFVPGQIKLDAGEKVATVRYALFLTCEVVGDERIRKIRAMLVRRDLLDDFPYPDALPQLENPWHADRIKTLRKAAAVWKTEPDLFLTLEVCV